MLWLHWLPAPAPSYVSYYYYYGAVRVTTSAVTTEYQVFQTGAPDPQKRRRSMPIATCTSWAPSRRATIR